MFITIIIRRRNPEQFFEIKIDSLLVPYNFEIKENITIFLLNMHNQYSSLP